MPNFEYRAINGSGKVAGSITAESVADAERRLLQQNLTILSLAPATGNALKAAKQASSDGTSSSRKSLFKKKISVQDAADILRNLAVMAEAGVPFVEALESVVASSRTPAIQAALQTVRDGVISGQSLSASLRLAPEMFPTLVTDMVKIAESGGKLDVALANGAGYLERVAALRKKIMNAMMYPAVMLSVSVLTIAILILFVMPRFAQVFSTMKAELPITTKLMLSTGDFAKKNPLGTLFYIVGFIGLIFFLTKLPATRKIINKIAQRTPLLGELLRRLALSRALQSISTLTAANVPLLQAIEHGARVAGPTSIGKALLKARDDIEQGKPMSDALNATNAFPKTLIQMVAVGEKTGRLPQLLARMADQMDVDVDARLKALVAVIEPLMIVFMGTLVGGITVSIIGPIYSVVENIK